MATSNSRAARGAALALFIAGILIAILHGYPPRISQAIDAATVKQREGFSYVARIAERSPKGLLAAFLGASPDTNETPSRSKLILSEQGAAMGPAHSLHVEIAKVGQGRYSHWGDDVIFSATDNSDPRSNGRAYAVSYEVAPPLWLAIGFLLGGAIVFFRPWRGVRAAGRVATRRSRVGLLAAAIVLLCAGIAATLLYCFPASAEHDLDLRALNHWGGHAYALAASDPASTGPAALLLDNESDSPQFPAASRLELLEDGKRIGSPHAGHAEIMELGQGRFSHWGRVLVFSTPDNSNPASNGRRYTARYQVAPASWLPLALLLAALGLLVLASRQPDAAGIDGQSVRGRIPAALSFAARHRAWLFWGGIAAVVCHLNAVFLLFLPAAVPWPDTDGYLGWWMFRTLGYPAFLYGQHMLLATWDYLPLVQLNLLLAGVVLLAYALVRVSGSYTIGWMLVVAVFAAGSMLLSAADVLTEAAFSAFVLIHVAFMLLFLAGQRSLMAVLAGVTLALAILLKSVAVVFVGPLLLLVAFLPGARRALLFLALLPAVAAWLVPSAYNLVRNGFFESSIAGGYALAGHVAWAIHPRPGSAHPEAASRIEKRLAPVLAKRPPEFRGVDHYVDYTLNEYNLLLWGNITPEMTEVLPACRDGKDNSWDLCTWRSCTSRCKLEMNRVLLTLSREAIAAEPGRYAYHVVAHKYAMWRHVFASGDRFITGVARRAEALAAAHGGQANRVYQGIYARPARLPSMEERESLRVRAEQWPVTRLLEIATISHPVRKYLLNAIDYLAIGVMVIAFAASALVLRLSRLSPAGRAFCYVALCLNAYFLGHALAQPFLVRYAWTMQGLVPALLLLGACFTVQEIRKRLAARRHAEGEPLRALAS